MLGSLTCVGRDGCEDIASEAQTDHARSAATGDHVNQTEVIVGYVEQLIQKNRSELPWAER